VKLERSYAVLRRLSRTNRQKFFASEAAIFRDAREETRSAVLALQALTPPVADKAQFERYLSAREEASAADGRIADAAARGDTRALEALGKDSVRAGAESRALARSYGFKKCGKALRRR
jgi:hypothetical protein